MTTHSFCDEEVGILQHLLLGGDTESEDFRAFSPRSFYPGQQQVADAAHATARELFGPANQGLVTPFRAADFTRMDVQDYVLPRTVTRPSGAGGQHTVDCSQWPRTKHSTAHRRAESPPSQRTSKSKSMNKSKDTAATVTTTATASGRTCFVAGCNKSSQSHGRCIRHGGGKRCSVAHCTRGAQVTGRCKAHGGGVRCSVDGCGKSSQGAGLCRTHGGGKLCVFPGCKKGTQRRGRCSTHGGARRCSVDGCIKVDRGGGFCGAHKKAMAQTNGTA